MLQLTACRLAAIAVTIALLKVAPVPGIFAVSVFAIAFGHYLLTYVYSRAQIGKALSSWRSAVALAALVGIGVLCYLRNINIVWTFAIHHALTEVFMLDRFTVRSRETVVRYVRGAGFVFHLALYLAFVRRLVPIANAADLTLGFLAVATVGYAAALLAARRLLSMSELVGHTTVELAGLALLFVSFRTNVSVMHIACYHFVLWAVFPAVQMAGARRYRGLATYVAATVAVTSVFVLISPLQLTAFTLSQQSFTKLFALFGQIHITQSLLLSRTNPWFVNRLGESLQRPWAASPAPTA